MIRFFVSAILSSPVRLIAQVSVGVKQVRMLFVKVFSEERLCGVIFATGRIGVRTIFEGVPPHPELITGTGFEKEKVVCLNTELSVLAKIFKEIEKFPYPYFA